MYHNMFNCNILPKKITILVFALSNLRTSTTCFRTNSSYVYSSSAVIFSLSTTSWMFFFTTRHCKK